MTTSIFSAAPQNTNDTNFRAWGGGLSTALAAVGLVKTTDTGQINWSTVAAPVASSTYQGYEIWRLNDALQASAAPVYFKIEYGSGPSGTTPSIRFTIGKGSDGTGTITGSLMAATACGPNGSTLTASNWYVSSGDGSMISIAPAVGYASTSGSYWHLTVERSRNAAGSATGIGLLTVFSQASGYPTVRQINYATGYTNFAVSFPAAVPTGATTPGVGGGGNTPLFTGICTDGQGNYWQPRSFLVGHSADIGQLTQMSVPGYGTYLFHTGFGNFSSGAIPQHCGAMAWF